LFCRDEKVDILNTLVTSLPKADQQKFHRLCDCKKQKEENKTAAGIFQTNNFVLGSLGQASHHGVFHHTSRINHSCVPNAETVWRRKKGCLEVRAIREIGAGEEVRICYLGKVRLSATSRQ